MNNRGYGVIRRWLMLFGCFAVVMVPVYAQTKPTYAYLGLEPDIVTNYIAPAANKKLGYVRVTVELMINDASKLEVAEHHMPLLRATAIDIFGRQPEAKIKSLTGREEIRSTIVKALQDIMKRETGDEVIKDVIFTKYLYQS